MWQFMVGCITGLYIGTYYDCKPKLDYMKKYIKDQFPEKK